MGTYAQQYNIRLVPCSKRATAAAVENPTRTYDTGEPALTRQ